MKKDITNIDHLILTFLEGTISSEDLQTLRKWVKGSAENEAYFKKMEEVWLLSGALASKKNFHKEEAFQIFKKRTTDKEIVLPKVRTLTFRKVLVYAACILLIFMAGLYVNNLAGLSLKNKELLTYSVEAPRRAKLKVNLPDGSMVWLNAASTLHYNNQFGVTNRDLSLQGEGYFEISENPKLALVVTSGDAKVKVLGTKFNVQNYEDDEELRVVLLEGAIDFSDRRYEKNVLLEPNQMVSFNKKNGILKLKEINAEYSNAWINNTIFFNEEKLSKIAKVIERAFDVTIQFDSEDLKNLVFYGDLTTEVENVVQIMDIMSATNKFSYKYDMENKIIRISH